MPQRLAGAFYFPSRMTVLPVTGRAIALVSPIACDEELARKVAALGEVRLLIAPNLLDHLYVADAAARRPAATVLDPRRTSQETARSPD